MKYYRLIDDKGYTNLYLNRIYKEDYKGKNYTISIKEIVIRYPKDFQECTEQEYNIQESIITQLPEEYVVECESSRESNICFKLTMKDDKNYHDICHWKYIIKENSITDNSGYRIKDYIPTDYEHLPVFPFKVWQELYNKQQEFVFPEKWCIINQYQEVRDYLANKYDNSQVKYFKQEYIGWDGCQSHNGVHGCSVDQFKSGTVEITFEQFKTYILKETNMDKQDFTIEGSIALKKAFVEEGGFKVLDETTINFAWLTSIPGEKYKLQGETGKCSQNFILPQDWDKALKYVKNYWEEEFKVGDYVYVISADVGATGVGNQFGVIVEAKT